MAFVFFKLILHFILGHDRPIPAARKLTPLIVFVTVVVVTLATLYKGLKHILADADWLSGQVAVLISVGAGVAVAAVGKVFIDRFLRGDGLLPLREQLERVERLFAPLVVATSCCVAFAHGANDVANAVGPLAAVVQVIREGVVAGEVPVPFWVLALGGAGITAGLAMFGYRVMRTVGEKITQITPSRGVAANLAATTTVLACSKLGLPVSTTHTLVGAILGVGLARGLGAVNRQVTRNIFGSWLITVPAAAGLSVVLFILARVFLLDLVVQAVEACPA